jgi:hypothetical protein
VKEVKEVKAARAARPWRDAVTGYEVALTSITDQPLDPAAILKTPETLADEVDK